jgi:hypothetical protein
MAIIIYLCRGGYANPIDAFLVLSTIPFASNYKFYFLAKPKFRFLKMKFYLMVVARKIGVDHVYHCLLPGWGVSKRVRDTL